MGATVRDIAEAELCYAPQFGEHAGHKDAAGVALKSGNANASGAAKDPINMAGFIASNYLDGQTPLADWTAFHAAIKAAETDPSVRPRAQDARPLHPVYTAGGAQKVPVVLDVRNPGEVAAEPLPHGVNIPLGA
jgi:hypothetical protein